MIILDLYMVCGPDVERSDEALVRQSYQALMIMLNLYMVSGPNVDHFNEALFVDRIKHYSHTRPLHGLKPKCRVL
ncbi:hypothetical protein ACOSP7_014404 [Xanthoceras sorbifolium]